MRYWSPCLPTLLHYPQTIHLFLFEPTTEDMRDYGYKSNSIVRTDEYGLLTYTFASLLTNYRTSDHINTITHPAF